VRGDRFDALMNYPLAEAILGFAGGSGLNLGIVRGHHEYAANIRRLSGQAFASRVQELATVYDARVVASQLNLLGSHDAPRMRTVLGGEPARVRLAFLLQATLPGAPCIYYGDEIGLVGGNDPECRGAFPWDETSWEPGLRETVRALLHLRSTEPALRDGPLTLVGTSDWATAFERGAGPARFVVAVNAGDSPVRLDLRFGDAPAGAGGHLASVALPGLSSIVEARILGGRASIELPACAGTILRVV
jgi:glycosidase